MNTSNANGAAEIPPFILPLPPVEGIMGPRLIAASVMGVESGIIISQSLRFWSQSDKEPIVVKVCVLFVAALSVFQTVISFNEIWVDLVVNFGNLVRYPSTKKLLVL